MNRLFTLLLQHASLPGRTEYYLNVDRALLVLRYPKFLFQVKQLLGDHAELLVSAQFTLNWPYFDIISVSAGRIVENRPGHGQQRSVQVADQAEER